MDSAGSAMSSVLAWLAWLYNDSVADRQLRWWFDFRQRSTRPSGDSHTRSHCGRV